MDVDLLSAVMLHALAWLSFGLGHSLLAAGPGRAGLTAAFGRGHRLAYNAIALIHLGLVFWVGLKTLSPLPAFSLSHGLIWTAHGVFGTGLLFGLWSLRFYDGGRLLGTRQLREPGGVEDEALRLDGPHRWVRHPLYSAAFLILWGRALDPLGLSTAVWGTLYLLVGTWFEERKLLALYGESYATYRRRVPAFIPWKGAAAP